MNEEYELKAKYIVIPIEIAFHKELTPTDKLLFPLIDYLDGEEGCFASNGYLASQLGVSEITISNGITRLEQQDLVERISFDGRKRVIKVKDNLRTALKNSLRQDKTTLKGRVKVSFKDNNKSLMGIDNISSKEDNTLSDDNESTSFNNIPVVLKRRKIPLSEKPKKIPYSVEQILTVWNTSGLRKHENPETKIYQTCVDNIRNLMLGKFFYNNTIKNGYQQKKFTRDEIIMAIGNFKLAALNPDYEPSGGYKEYLKKISFPDFLYNPFTENGEKSLFIKFFEEVPKLCIESVKIPKDEHPEITKALTQMYIEKVKGGVNGLGQREKIKLICGAKRIYKFFQDYANKIDPLFIRTVEARVELVIDALMENYKDSVQVGNFSSDYTYDTVLPIYLQRQAVLNSHLQ